MTKGSVVPIRPDMLARVMRDPAAAGLGSFRVMYHEGETNHCPGCGRMHWHVGRVTAECAFCGTALPLSG